MGKNGGKREGAGRPPKILEIKLIEQMDAIAVPNEIWKALLYKCKEGDTAAHKTLVILPVWNAEATNRRYKQTAKT
jgi:hypothetical protein